MCVHAHIYHTHVRTQTQVYMFVYPSCMRGYCAKLSPYLILLWCWRRLLRVPWTARRSNQSILKEISPGCSLEGLMLKLKLQCFGHLMQRADSFEKILMLGKIEGRRIRGWQSMRWLDAIPSTMTWIWVNSGSWWWTGRPGMLQSMGSQRVGHNWATEVNWTEPYQVLQYTLQDAQAILYPINWPVSDWQSPSHLFGGAGMPHSMY